MGIRIYIYLNGETFTKNGTVELVNYFLAAREAIGDFDKLERVNLKDKVKIISYYFYTVDQEDTL